MTAILDAARRGDVGTIVRLLRDSPHEANVADANGKTALHWAAEADDVRVAQALIDARANVEERAEWGATPFDWAATLGSARVAALLLSAGATGLTVITGAALGMLDAVASFLAAGVNPATHRRRDAPPVPNEYWPADTAHIAGDVISDALYAAARNGHTPVVEHLHAHGAKIDAKGVFGATGLHWAALNGHEETVYFLLSRGADGDIEDVRFHSTADGWALEGGHTHLADVIRQSRGTR